jgi:hypothetical protein
MQRGRGHGPPADRRAAGDFVHVEHMRHIGEIRPIVRDIAEGDERHEQRRDADAGDLGEADDHASLLKRDPSP